MGLPWESSCSSHHSPSKTSSRGGSASPDGSRHCSRSCSWGPSRRTDEDRQEEQSLLDFVSVMVTLQSLNKLSEAPSESRKTHGFRVALEDDNQPASSYRLPVGGALGTYSRMLMTIFCHLFWACVQRC